MFNKSHCRVAVVIVVIASANVQADLPADRSVHYVVRNIPTDPSSGILFTMSLNIQAIEQVGNSVAWEITSVVFNKPAGGVDEFWSVEFPFVNTNDGLWWVEHADPVIPVRNEFVYVPTLLGTAVPDDPNNQNLNFDIAGGIYIPPPEGSPYETTTVLSYSLTTEDSNDSGDDEPVEVPSGVNDPF